MRRFWTKIGLGAVGVFIVGMFFITLGRRGVGYVKSLTHSEHLSIPLAMMPFQVDGERKGTFRGIEVNRSRSDAGRTVRFTVKMPSARDARAMKDCVLAISDGNLGPRSDFRCLCEDEATEGSYRRVGEVVFEPGRVVRPLLVELDRSDAEAVDPNAGHRITANADIRDGAVRVSAFGSSGETLKFHAGEGTASLVVRDGNGRKVVDLKADQSNGVLRIVNSKGKEVVRVDTNQ